MSPPKQESEVTKPFFAVCWKFCRGIYSWYQAISKILILLKGHLGPNLRDWAQLRHNTCEQWYAYWFGSGCTCTESVRLPFMGSLTDCVVHSVYWPIIYPDISCTDPARCNSLQAITISYMMSVWCKNVSVLNCAELLVGQYKSVPSTSISNGIILSFLYSYVFL